ncbi:MFS transporter [Sphingomonas sp.]|uniref:MFS transporter n=1 Tax=Sphingomonas sp. TaxID=28214 RepID=UPI0025F25979|nr:MFS transporter [Sphingomonas sp.]
MNRTGSSRHDPRWTLVMSVAASSLSFIDGSILNVALPAIRQGTGAAAAEVQWLVNIYTLPLAALILLGGALGDHQGRRRWLVIGTGLFGIASLVCALSNSLEMLLAGRALQGIGAALLLPNSLALLNGAYDGEARGQAIGTWAAAGAIAAAIAPLTGGWLVEHAGWPSIFYINLPFAAAAIAVALTKVEEVKEPERARLDLVGAVLATLGLGAATYGLTLWSQTFKLTPLSTATIGSGAVLLVAFVLWEKRLGNHAMVPLTLFSNRCFSALNLMTFLLYGAFGGALLLIPYVLIEAGHYSPIEAGLSLLPLSILLGLASPLMGKLAVRVGPKIPLTLGPIIVGAGLLLATRIADSQAYWTHAFPAILVMSLGMTLAVAPLTSTVLAAVEKHQTGMASGFNSAVARLGGLIVVALMGAVLMGQGKALLQPFATALVIMGIVAILAGLAAFFGLSGKWTRNPDALKQPPLPEPSRHC